MKRLLLIAFTALSIHAIAQTNIFPSSGNVGIGTDNPIAKLDVNGGIRASYSDTDIGGCITIANPAKTGNGQASSWCIYNMSGGYNNSLQFWAYDNIGCTSGGLCNNRLTLMDNGNVGVGTTCPQSKLHILDGNNNIRFGDFGSSTAGIELSDGAVNSAESVYLLGWENSFRVSIGNPNKGNHLFTIQNSGNVGIGTTNPAYKLDVLGTIRAKEVLVNLDGGADFVFEKGYKLPTIEHVANYVQANKHLPDIPSANEMVKHGVSMGDMQVKLLQKVEELTLYAIHENISKKELESKYNALLEKVEMLTKQIEKR